MSEYDVIEVKYLAIQWSNKETVSKIDESIHSLAIDNVINEDGLSYKTISSVTFPKVYHYLGFHIAGEVKHTPYFKQSNGEKKSFTPFTSPKTNKVWWIATDGWDKKNKRYYSEVFRTMGNYDLVIQNEEILLKNDDLNFTVHELEHYLSDFKDDLWLLILDNDSPAKAKIDKQVPNIFQDEVLSLYKEFIEHSELLIKKPNMYLSERQSSLPIKKVKPVPRTFRELMQSPSRQSATSRDFYESYDTSENRYIHYCVRRALYLMRSFERLAESQIDMYSKKISAESEWKQELLSQTTKIVDKDVLEGEIVTVRHQLESEKKRLLGLKIDIDYRSCIDQHHNKFYKELRVSLGGKTNSEDKNSYFVNELNGVLQKDFLKEFGVNTIILTLLSNAFEKVDVFDEVKILTKCSGFITWKKYTKQYQNETINEVVTRVTGILNFYQITCIDFDENSQSQMLRLSQELTNLERRKKELESLNWTLPLTTQEIKDRRHEGIIIDRKIKTFEQTKHQISSVSFHLPRYISRLKKVLAFFTEHKVKRSSSCPNSMVFIQNPLYAGCKSLFKQAMNLSGLDLSLFDRMMQVDEIGLVNISNLYEKWCLIQTVKVLKNVYRFEVKDGWQSKLIDSVLESQYDIAIEMFSKDKFQSVVVTYEKVLSNRKRPDIVIDIFFNTYENAYYNQQNHLRKLTEKTKRLVIDAKFQNFTQESLEKLVAQLYFPNAINLPHAINQGNHDKNQAVNYKNYSENFSNQVFIMHPKPRVISKPTSPLAWSKFCDYGQSNGAKHKYGSIFVSPSLKHPHSADNLQRLLGMFLQDNSQRVQGVGANWHDMYCMGCGNNKRDKMKLSYSHTQGGSDKWEIICSECAQLTVQNICYNCKNIIFKNGLKWTYHRTRAEQFTNVVCPNCESFL